MSASRFRAFTLIELLVVVAIIALLISILLPSLSCAREQARAARCGTQIRALGTGMHGYFTEHKDWIPGVNTSGLATRVAKSESDAEGALRRQDVPVQSFDWMSPLIRYDVQGDMGATRAKRMQLLLNRYRCPSFVGLKIDFLYAAGLNASPDKNDFRNDDTLEDWSPLSYLMPAHFQWWGYAQRNHVLQSGTSSAGRPEEFLAETAGDFMAAYHPGDYRSKIDQVGVAARKIAIADGMRYLTRQGDVDFDVDPSPRWFGAFSSNGAWWAGSEEYGVRKGSLNWDGDQVNQDGDNPESKGRNLTWSYRHGCNVRDAITSAAQDNKGSINALFFDGHVKRLDDRASREAEFWYPRGSIIDKPRHGMRSYPADFEVP